jgi:C1A family cysteine protease
VKNDSPNQLIAALRLGPVAAAIDASCLDFIFYSEGILDSSSDCGTDVNYAVLVVAYNSTNNYFTIKNSMGGGWGINGFGWIAVEDGVGALGI